MNRKETAASYGKQGYNCAQQVLLAFNDLTGLDEKTAIKVAASLGGGFGYAGEICGAVSGMAVALGLIYGFEDPADKPAWYEEVNKMVTSFKEDHEGRIRCPEFTCDGKYPCAELIADAIDRAEAYIAAH